MDNTGVSHDPVSYWSDPVDDDIAVNDLVNFSLDKFEYFDELWESMNRIISNNQSNVSADLVDLPSETPIVNLDNKHKMENINFCNNHSRNDRFREPYKHNFSSRGREMHGHFSSRGREMHGNFSSRGREMHGRYKYNRKRERDSTEKDRECRGYWERDSLGKLVYKTGNWEADFSKEAKRVKLDSLVVEKKSGEEIRKEKPVEEQARKYQLDVLEQAKKKNTIAFLETGAGKTLIAILLIKSMCSDMVKEGKKILAIFLVPKVPLVYQQAEVIRDKTGYKVGHYCGEMVQDFWDARRWQREFESKQMDDDRNC